MVPALWIEVELNWGEEQADMGGGLHGHLRPCDVLACAATEGQVWVHGPTTAGVCVDVHGTSYH